MQLTTAISLIENDSIEQQEITSWADFGCGSGLFTEALAHYLKRGSKIYAVDKTIGISNHTTLNGVLIESYKADFILDKLLLPRLDGILMANSLHYVKDKPAFIEKTKQYRKEGMFFLIVEYDTDIPVKTWVPYPVSYTSLKILFENEGYTSVVKLNEQPSVFGSIMYTAIIKPGN